MITFSDSAQVFSDFEITSGAVNLFAGSPYREPSLWRPEESAVLVLQSWCRILQVCVWLPSH
jgi:hypothetical protein